VEKEYLVETDGVPSAGALRRLRQGVELEDGTTAPATVGVVGPGVIRVVIHEGRNRQVRRMCEAVGHPVRRLVRTRIGPVADRRLKPGQWRHLEPAEVRALGRAAVPRALAGPSRPKGRRTGPG
jgi:23S rRNA pseudouridine2605 synthase